MERSEPILPSRDLAETRAFYRRLGFTCWFDGRGGWDYEIVSRGHLVVHFFLNSSLVAERSDAGCYLRVVDADRLHAELSALGLPGEGIPRMTAPRDEPWGMREFAIVDTSGNLLRIGHDLDAERAYVPPQA
jgi:catechol 2,3-dioxygenase-like lactoylglutathione lyase family enzyme